MSVMAGMEDLKPAKVLSWDPSTGRMMALCKNDSTGATVKEYELFIDPNGKVRAKEYVPDTTTDQTPLTDEQREERLAMRWKGIDQR